MKFKGSTGLQAVVIVLLMLIVVLLALLLLRSMGPKQIEPAVTITEEQRNSGRIGYATTGVTVATDAESLQAAVDAMNDTDDTVGVEYKVVAYSEDGVNFDCYIGNPADSPRDKFIVIYADANLTDELFVSGLIRPGEAFERVTLNRKLEDVSTKCYVMFSDVAEDEDGNQVVTGEAVMTVTFNVI